MVYDPTLWQPATIPDNLDSPGEIGGRVDKNVAYVVARLWSLLSRSHLRTSRAIKILNKFRVIMDADEPAASGSGVLWVDTANEQLWYDDPAADPYVWISLGGAAGESVALSTSNFDNNLSVADDTVQKAFDTLDNLIAGGGGDYNIDGGRADSIYTPEQSIDGGGA